MQNPQPVPITYVYASRPPSVRPGFASKSGRSLGIAQVSFGALLIIFQIVSIVEFTALMFVGHGIWTGIIIIIAGSFGIAAAKHKTSCLIITFMVMSIIAAVFSVVPLSLSAASIPIDSDYHAYGWYRSNEDVRVALDGIMLVLSLLEIIAAIWSSAICCKVLCCAPPSAATMTQGQIQVQYVATQPGTNPVQPVNIIIAGPSGVAPQQPQQAFMYPALQGQQIFMPPGQPGGLVQVAPTTGQAHGGGDSPPPAYTTGEAGQGNLAQGNAPPMEQKSRPLVQ